MKEEKRTKKTKKEKPRCKACVPCSMGVVGCEWDDKPHGHGGAQRCPECDILYYHVHPHSNTCSRATPIGDDVEHDEHNMKRQLMLSDRFTNKNDTLSEAIKVKVAQEDLEKQHRIM